MNGHPLQMEVDTGAAVSLAPESAVSALLPSTVATVECNLENLYWGTDSCERSATSHCSLELRPADPLQLKATGGQRPCWAEIG